MSKLWIVVADAARARIFSAEMLRGEWTQLEERTHPTSRAKARELVTDQPGYSEHSGRFPSGVGEDANPKREEQEHFAVELAKHIEESAKKGAFEECVLVAPARFLGALRKHLGPVTTKRVRHTLARDLTDAARAEIERSLAADFDRPA